MAVAWLLVCHGLITALVVVSFLCGQWPIFQNTPIQRIHHFLTFGAYDYFLQCVGYVLGEKGTNAILSVEYFCCDRPNPILQGIFWMWKDEFNWRYYNGRQRTTASGWCISASGVLSCCI